MLPLASIPARTSYSDIQELDFGRVYCQSGAGEGRITWFTHRLARPISPDHDSVTVNAQGASRPARAARNRTDITRAGALLGQALVTYSALGTEAPRAALKPGCERRP
jgi:hypothetical protein